MTTEAQPTGQPSATVSQLHGGGPRRGFLAWIGHRELPTYPKPAARYFYLAVVILASITLWYQYFIPPSVGQILIVKFHMSFRFFVLTLILSNLAGMVAAVAGQITDRIGRCWVVIGGLGIVALIQLFALPNAANKAEYTVAIVAVGLFEGIILVATPTLVRDFTPQLGRASAMGFWTLGPVAGLLVATELAAHTLGATSGDWQRMFIISGVVGLVVFGVALLFLRELSPQIRSQVMTTERDRVLVQLRAKGIDVASALKRPWRQMLRFDIIISALAIAVMLVLFYTAAGTFPSAFFPTVFVKATNYSSLPQANALAAWVWATDCVALVVFGVLSDLLKVRKPFMLAGALGMLVFIPVLISHVGHTTSSYYTLVWVVSVLFAFQAMAYSPWMASFTETAEAHNPALIATALSIWGGLVRLVTAITLVFIPFVIVSAGLAANNAYRPMDQRSVVAINDIVAGRTPSAADVTSTGPATQIANITPPAATIQATYPTEVAIVQSDPTAFAEATKYPGTTILTQNPKLFVRISHDAAKVVGPAHATSELTQIQKISPQLQFLNRWEPELTQLQIVRSTAPSEWQHWLWVCFGCTAVFIPAIFVMRGRWSPRRAREDEREHEELVQDELARLREASEESPATTS